MSTSNKFEQLNNEPAEQTNFGDRVLIRKKVTGVSYNKMVKQNDTKLTEEDDEYDGEEEIHFDESNNYEYDDEFGLSAGGGAGGGTAATSSNNESLNQNENIQFSPTQTTVTSLTVKLKQFKNNFLNKNLLKSSLLPFTSNLPHYSYNSTDSTLVQIVSAEQQQQQQQTDKNNESDNQTVHVVYDIEKKKASHKITSSATEEQQQQQQLQNKLRLATNPLENYLDKIEMDLIKKTNESDA